MSKQDLYAIAVFLIFMVVSGLAGTSDLAQYLV